MRLFPITEYLNAEFYVKITHTCYTTIISFKSPVFSKTGQRYTMWTVLLRQERLHQEARYSAWEGHLYNDI